MSLDVSIAGLEVQHLIAAISTNQPAPGAGAAGAVALALAAACAAKAATISVKHKPRDETLTVPREAALTLAREAFTEIARRALSGADADAEGFEAFMRSRDPNIAARLVRTDCGLIDLSTALTLLIDEIQPLITPSLAADLFAARALADAARQIEMRNISETAATPRPSPGSTHSAES
jgi:hypothetical protein